MYTIKDIKQTFDPTAKTWTLSLAGHSLLTLDGCHSRPPSRDAKEMFLAQVEAIAALTPEVSPSGSSLYQPWRSQRTR